jgi:hypothetical protein
MVERKLVKFDENVVARIKGSNDMYITEIQLSAICLKRSNHRRHVGKRG